MNGRDVSKATSVTDGRGVRLLTLIENVNDCH